MRYVNLNEMAAAARERLPQMAYDYYASGSDDEVTLRENQTAYQRLRLYQRVLQGMGPRSFRTTLLGQPLDMPILVAPTAFQCMAHPEGECATARAVGAAGTVMILSTLATTAIEDVAAAATGPLWFQLYIHRDQGLTLDLVRRAEAAGCQALVVTVDAPAWGKRERDVRNSFSLPEGLVAPNLVATGGERFHQQKGRSALSAYIDEHFKLDLGWADVDWLCSQTNLPVWIKGVAHPADATPALDHGVAGVMVSNHGGRQLDTTQPTIEALPAVVEALDGRLPIIVDGGIRRGTDVVKAIALGATAVAIGRPVLWGLTLGGEAGVSHVLAILRDELDRAMALCGVSSVAEISGAVLAP